MWFSDRIVPSNAYAEGSRGMVAKALKAKKPKKVQKPKKAQKSKKTLKPKKAPKKAHVSTFAAEGPISGK